MFIDLCLKNLELVKEINTEYTFKCPICKENKLKVNKESSKYYCYANSCNSKELYKIIVGNDRFFTSTRFVNPNNFKKINYSILDSINLKSNKFSQCDFDNSKYKCTNNLQTYYYREDLKLERIERKKDKIFTPKYYYNGEWITGNNGEFSYYLPCTNISKGVFVCVEGEKCTVSLSKLGITTFNIYQPYSSNQNKISSILSELCRVYSDIRAAGIMYICDNDVIGYSKGKKFVEVCNYLNIPNKLVTMNDISFFSVLSEGYDIADLLEDYPQINIKDLSGLVN